MRQTTPYAGDAGILLLIKWKLIIEKGSHHSCCRVSFLILCNQGKVQCKKQTIEYPLLHAHLYRCDADYQQIETCSVTEHHLYSGSWN
jgi:hypothetical protein